MNSKEFICNTLAVIETFAERYLPYAEKKNVTDIKTVDDGKIRFTINNEYYLFAWMTDKELHIESEYGDDIFKSCREDWWTDAIVHYMRFGTQII